MNRRPGSAGPRFDRLGELEGAEPPRTGRRTGWSPLSALAFIAAATVRNMLRRQLRRVREPRYLVATLFGLFYVVNVFVRPGMGAGRAGGRLFTGHLGPSVVAGGITWLGMLVLLLGWLFGGDESGLAFSDAEIQFLFPAPLSRRQLVHYKLARTLLFSLLSAIIISVTAGRRVATGSPLFVLGAFLGVATTSLHLVAASLTRLSLLERGLGSAPRRALALGVPAALIGAVITGIHRVPMPWPARWSEVEPYLARLFETPPLSWAGMALAPAVHVALAKGAADLLLWLPAALGVLGLHYAWALSTGASFEQASIASAERRAKRIEGMRRGQHALRASARPPFRLRAQGHPAVAIYWKNLTAAVRVLSLRVTMVILLPAIAGGVAALGSGAPFNRELGAICFAVLAASTTFFGVQIYRIDFRLDLASMDMLKSLPLRGVHLALAEVLAPFTVLTLAGWLFILAAAVLAPPWVAAPFGRVAPAAALMIVLPAITLPGLLVQNAAALLFPAWVESGATPPRGIEAIGQRLLTLVGTLLAVTLALAPAALVGAVSGALLQRVVGSAALPLAALLGAAVVAAESAAAFFGLGWAFERFDPGRR